MYNKIISFLILIFLFWGIYFLYYYFFILNKWNLTLISNVENYKVYLYNNKIKTSFWSECKIFKCELIDLAPFEYEITIKKDWYKNIKKNIKISKKATLKIEINLEKELQIKKIQEEENTLSWTQNNNIDKFRELAELKKSYLFFDEKDFWYFYFKDNWDWTLFLFRKKDWIETKLYSFLKTDKKNLDLKKVENDDEEFLFISYNENKYLYDLKYWKIWEFLFPQNVDYVKKYNNIFSIINEKWTFLYDLDNEKIEYFDLFKDFVYLDKNHYLWIIFKDEIQKLQDYNLENYKDNLIIKYNFNNKEMKVLQTTNIDIKKIIIQNWNIYFLDNFNNKYLVDNFN